ncbi:hypothetical protein CCAX7_64710 [Capsulimonas corticalis]|uniref:Uncharacterized protein n=1 Tax=Capsulimonas corticalis TaxID=2219043 RepID=A0A402CQP4_9BACT|nr:hypothetical protein [Capsulimonas corticalis]BDI34420.1 hypothetical protein CCAX7_64710 [Capsulimonas corticalis]
MKAIFSKLLVPAALMGTMMIPMAAQADTYHRTHSINARLHHEHERIVQGERSGQLTRREAAHLNRREWRLHRQEHHLRETGDRFTPSERARMRREENRTSHAIYRQKHDNQVR